MQYFFWTKGIFVDRKIHVGFEHFDALHLGWLAFFVLCAVLCCLFYRRLGEIGRRRFRRILAGLIVGNELFKMACLTVAEFTVARGAYSINYLPLHLCSINIILIVIHARFPNKMLDNFIYAIGLPTAVIALIVPTWTRQPFLNFNHLHSFTVHIMIAIYPLMLLVGGDIRPRAREIWKAMLLLLGLAVPVYFFNLHFGTDYMFLRTGAGTPLVWFEQHWGNHLYGFPIFTVAILALMYLPIEIGHAIRRRHICSAH